MLNQEPYLDFVAQKAAEIGKLFLLDTGEGNDFIDPMTGWYIEDLSGWLIEPTEEEKLSAAQENGTADDEFSTSYVFVKWSRTDSGKLEINFRKY